MFSTGRIVGAHRGLSMEMTLDPHPGYRSKSDGCVGLSQRPYRRLCMREGRALFAAVIRMFPTSPTRR